MRCKNCDNSLNGNFCTYCGQNSKVERINTKNFLSELSSSIFQVNKGFFFTLKELFTRPGHSIREFITGKRKNHFKPIAFVLTLSTVYFFVSKISDSPTIIDDFFSGFNRANEDKDVVTNSSQITKWLSDNYAYTTLLLLPIFSLATYISFLGTKKNYLEHIVINSYITGLQAIFYSLFMVIGVLISNEDLTVLIAVVVSLLFNFWTFYQFFTDEKPLSVILRLVLSYFIYYIFLSIFLFAFVVEHMINR